MEDILASIRRILNDDEPAADAHGGQAAAEHQGVDRAAPPQDDVFVLDQSMLVAEPAAAAAVPPASIPPQPAPTIAPAGAAAFEPPAPPQQGTPLPMMHEAPTPATEAGPDEPLMAPSTAAAAAASMGALVRVIGQQQTAVYRGGPTLEDMVRDEIRPMVRAWLDENLPPIVERMVRAEIARVTEGK